MTEPQKAVFLSYASQDTEAARRICECLRSAGIEVWFDQNELRGGDVWDQNIRHQIHDCAMFMPIISANTESRTEGYFRLEWKLAVDRSHLMADDAAFLFPVVIDDTAEPTARVPDKFRTVQWTRLPAGATPPAFSQRVAALLRGAAKPVQRPALTPSRPARRTMVPAWAVMIAIVTIVGGLLVGGLALWRSMQRAPGAEGTGAKAPTAAAQQAPAHSIAVLPFADMSEHGDQAYISEGLAEQLLNLLSKVPGLQVAARTSAFSFKGHAADIPTIGRQLLVANVLEGSVRKIGNHLRVTAQLVRADNGYEIWSEIYDRDLGDIFRIQDEIASHVVKSLQLKLLGAEVPRSVSTQNTDAYLVFLQGRAKMASQRLTDFKPAIADFERALKLDPNYSPAYVELAAAKMRLAEFEVTVNRKAAVGNTVEEARLLLERALVLDPRNAQAYVERGYLRAFTDIEGGEQDVRKGIALDPNSPRGYETLATVLNQDPRRRDEVPALFDKAHLLDPLEPKYEVLKAQFLFYARSDTRGADALYSDVVARSPTYVQALWRLGEIRHVEGHFADAVMYIEQALKLDPLIEFARLALINTYVDLGDIDAARAVADGSPHALPSDRLRLLINDRDWSRAAEVSYAAIDADDLPLINESWCYLAMRMDAGASRDFSRARATLERQSQVTWSAQGAPTLPLPLGASSAPLEFAAMLMASGEHERGERVVRAALANMDYVARDFKRGDLWFLYDRSFAWALLGDRKATVAAVKRLANGNHTMWMAVTLDPIFDPIRSDPDYQLLARQFAEAVALERQKVDRLRAEGRVPMRGKPGKVAEVPH